MNAFISGELPTLKTLATRSLLFRLEESIKYHSGRFGDFEVKKGFITDLASIPSFIPIGQSCDIISAAILHDSLYAFQTCSKDFADRLFKEAMGVNNTPTWKIQLFYYAVRLFGGRAWNKAKKLKESNPTDKCEKLVEGAF